jgi:hypothetical protein
MSLLFMSVMHRIAFIHCRESLRLGVCLKRKSGQQKMAQPGYKGRKGISAGWQSVLK